MISITSKTKKEYTISLLQSDKVHLFNNLEKIIESNQNTTLVFNIRAKNVTITDGEYERLKGYGVTLNLFFKNKEELSVSEPLVADCNESKSVFAEKDELGAPSKVLLFKKPIRSGQTEIFKVGTILTENINKMGKVISYNNLVLLKKNHGTITIEDGSLLIDPSKNHGEIVINGVNITDFLMDDPEVRTADKVLIEKEEENIKYKIYQ